MKPNALASLVILASCGTAPSVSQPAPTPVARPAANADPLEPVDLTVLTGTWQPSVTDFSARGPYTVSRSEGQAQLGSCEMDYVAFTPATLASDVTVFLSHGFARRARHLAILAEHLASFGLRVVTPELCHASVTDSDHAQNGADLVELAASLAPNGEPVIYAGHSAGGLASLFASRDDARTLALLGLDLVDRNDDGLAAAHFTSVPALGLLGAPHSCNATNNGLSVFAALTGARILEVLDASHCDFEQPTSLLCKWTCGGTTKDRMAVVRGLSAAYIAWMSGIDASGEAWIVKDGVELTRLVDEGKVDFIR